MVCFLMFVGLLALVIALAFGVTYLMMEGLPFEISVKDGKVKINRK